MHLVPVARGCVRSGQLNTPMPTLSKLIERAFATILIARQGLCWVRVRVSVSVGVRVRVRVL